MQCESSTKRLSRIAQRVREIKEESLEDSSNSFAKIRRFQQDYDRKFAPLANSTDIDRSKSLLEANCKLEKNIFGDDALQIVRQFNIKKGCDAKQGRMVDGGSRNIDVQFVDTQVLIDEIEEFEQRSSIERHSEEFCGKMENSTEQGDQSRKYFERIKRKIDHKKRLEIENEKAACYIEQLIEDKMINDRNEELKEIEKKMYEQKSKSQEKICTIIKMIVESKKVLENKRKYIDEFMEKRQVKLNQKLIETLDRERRNEKDKNKDLIMKHRVQYKKRLEEEKEIISQYNLENLRNMTIRIVKFVQNLKKVEILHGSICEIDIYPKIRQLKQKILLNATDDKNNCQKSRFFELEGKFFDTAKSEEVNEILLDAFNEQEVRDIKHEADSICRLSRSIYKGEEIQKILVKLIRKNCSIFDALLNLKCEFYFVNDLSLENNFDVVSRMRIEDEGQESKSNDADGEEFFDFALDDNFFSTKLPDYLLEGEIMKDEEIIENFLDFIKHAHHQYCNNENRKNDPTDKKKILRIKNFPYDVNQLEAMEEKLKTLVNNSLELLFHRSFIDHYQYAIKGCCHDILCRLFKYVQLLNCSPVLNAECESVDQSLEFVKSKSRLISKLKGKYGSKLYEISKLSEELSDYFDQLSDIRVDNEINGTSVDSLDNSILKKIDVSEKWREFKCFSITDDVTTQTILEFTILKDLEIASQICVGIVHNEVKEAQSVLNAFNEDLKFLAEQEKLDEEMITIMQSTLKRSIDKIFEILIETRNQKSLEILEIFRASKIDSKIIRFLHYSLNIFDSLKIELDQRNDMITAILFNKEPKLGEAFKTKKLSDSCSKLDICETDKDFGHTRDELMNFIENIFKSFDKDSENVAESIDSEIEKISVMFRKICNTRLENCNQEINEIKGSLCGADNDQLFSFEAEKNLTPKTQDEKLYKKEDKSGNKRKNSKILKDTHKSHNAKQNKSEKKDQSQSLEASAATISPAASTTPQTLKQKLQERNAMSARSKKILDSCILESYAAFQLSVDGMEKEILRKFNKVLKLFCKSLEQTLKNLEEFHRKNLKQLNRISEEINEKFDNYKTGERLDLIQIEYGPDGFTSSIQCSTDLKQ